MSAKRSKAKVGKRPKGPGESVKSRDAVLGDFRRIAGPLRGRNRDRKPKA
jgi:hypothetical protein